jgi:hypothetical protein
MLGGFSLGDGSEDSEETVSATSVDGILFIQGY